MTLEKIERFNLWRKGKPRGPLGLYLTLTERCNLTCVFCQYRNWEEFSREDAMTDEEWLKVIIDAAELGAAWVDLFGGEPLLRRQLLFKLMKVTKEYGISGSMVTNGMLLTRDVARRIVDARWNLVQVSIDAPVAEIHNRLRQNEQSFNRASLALDYLAEEKERVGSDLPHVQINMVLTSSNAHLLPHTLEFASAKKCQRVKFIPMVLSEKDAETELIPAESFPELFKETEAAMKTADALGLETNLKDLRGSLTNHSQNDKERKLNWETIQNELLNEHQGYPMCFSPWWALRVFPEGWATCCVSSHRKVVNIRGKRLRDVWNADEFEEIRRTLLKTTIAECERCCYVVASDNLAVREAISEHVPAIHKR